MRTRFDTLTGAIGRRTLALVLYPVDLTAFILRAFGDSRRHTRRYNRAAVNTLVSQIIFTGVDALPTITLIGVAVGLGLVSQLIALMHMFGSMREMVAVLAQVVALEMGPLLTAILIIGRSSSAIAVELGHMRLNKEVEGLWLLGVNTNDLLVTPRLLGTATAQLALAVYFTLIAIISGTLFAAAFVAPGYIHFLQQVPLALDPSDLAVFVIKNLLFGIIAGAAACYHGLQVERSPTEVPQQTQRAIVNAISLIFIVDGLFALMRL
jgi:phospholipid/cholesterol/gamma-HCH transport system permease protein